MFVNNDFIVKTNDENPENIVLQMNRVMKMHSLSDIDI
jgi:hypothetical protein